VSIEQENGARTPVAGDGERGRTPARLGQLSLTEGTPLSGGQRPVVTVVEALALARHYLEAGHLRRAEELYRRVLETDPANTEALYELGRAGLRAGRPAEAGACFRSLLRILPDHAEAWTELGVALLTEGKLGEAVACQQEALRLRPDLADAHNNLGDALFRLGEAGQAVACFQRAIHLDPDQPEVHFNLGTALTACGREGEAAAHFREAIRRDPGFIEAYQNLASLLMQEGEDAEALPCHRAVLALRPDDAAAHNNLGVALLEKGEKAAAAAHYREALRLDPNCSHALASVAIHDLYPLTEDEVGRLEALLAGPGLRPADACVLRFGLGNVRDRAGAYDEAFEQFRQGNTLRRRLFQQSGTAFDPRTHETDIDQLIRTFSAPYFQRARGTGIDHELPVFVVGMPRSGTSLVEQILASHPQVFGGGELRDIQRIVISLPARLGTATGYPACLEGAPAQALRALAERHLERLVALGGGAPRVTDKLPTNHLHLGLIATLFPRARIIHCRRNPLDTCVSCYLSYFRGLPFTWDLEDLGQYYRQYERLTAHWNAVLPLPVLEVRYEELVENQEEVSRRLVAFCGLEWDERCLAFHENSRPVHTVSALQVRRPIYKSSVGRWRRYEAHLQPLLKALGG
jgi:tetratricopeptide (TPR) repeat protein